MSQSTPGGGGGGFTFTTAKPLKALQSVNVGEPQESNSKGGATNSVFEQVPRCV